jgi:hypothetical protein
MAIFKIAPTIYCGSAQVERRNWEIPWISGKKLRKTRKITFSRRFDGREKRMAPPCQCLPALCATGNGAQEFGQILAEGRKFAIYSGRSPAPGAPAPECAEKADRETVQEKGNLLYHENTRHA